MSKSYTRQKVFQEFVVCSFTWYFRFSNLLFRENVLEIKLLGVVHDLFFNSKTVKFNF